MKLRKLVFVSKTTRFKRPFYDPSSRYRSFAMADLLRRRGYDAIFLSQHQFEKDPEQFTGAYLVQFHRPEATEVLLRYIMRQRKKQILVADYDDLVFDVSSVRKVPAVFDRKEDLTKVARSLAANAEAGQMFDHHTASTRPLAVLVDQLLGGDTTVINNGLDPTYVGIAAVLNQRPRRNSFDLGYFSGTASHDRDFESIAIEVADFLAEDQNRNLLLFGPLAIPEQLERFSRQIVQRKVVSYYEMPIHLAQCRMVLGPLIDNTFTRCKSGLKYFEAAALGTSVAASPIPDIDRFENPLLWKCNTAGEWTNAISAPSLDAKEISLAAAETIEQSRLEVPMGIWSEKFLVH